MISTKEFEDKFGSSAYDFYYNSSTNDVKIELNVIFSGSVVIDKKDFNNIMSCDDDAEVNIIKAEISKQIVRKMLDMLKITD